MIIAVALMMDALIIAPAFATGRAGHTERKSNGTVSSRGIRRSYAAGATRPGDHGKDASVPSIRTLRHRSLTWLISTITRVATPTPSRSKSEAGDLGGKRSIPAIPMLRHRQKIAQPCPFSRLISQQLLFGSRTGSHTAGSPASCLAAPRLCT
jgi:hypothetical protein